MLDDWWYGHPTRKDRIVPNSATGEYVYYYEYMSKSKRSAGAGTAQQFLDSLERRIRDVTQSCYLNFPYSHVTPQYKHDIEWEKRKENLHQCLMAYEVDPRDSTWNGSNSCHCQPFGKIVHNLLYMRKIKKEYYEYKSQQEKIENQKIENQKVQNQVITFNEQQNSGDFNETPITEINLDNSCSECTGTIKSTDPIEEKQLTKSYLKMGGITVVGVGILLLYTRSNKK